MSAGIGGINVDGAAAGAAGGGLTAINISAGTTSNNLSAVVFSNSNGMEFGLNGSTVTGRDVPISMWSNLLQPAAGPNSYVNNSWMWIQPFVLQNPVAFSNVLVYDFIQSVATAGNTSSAFYDLTANLVLYSRNVSTLSSVASFSNSYVTSWNSNNTTGIANIIVGIAVTGAATTLTQGEYYAALLFSTNNTSATAGTASTVLGNSHANYLAFLPSTATSYKLASSTGVNATVGAWPGMGLFSTGATRGTIAFSDYNAMSGASALNAPFAFILRGNTWQA